MIRSIRKAYGAGWRAGVVEPRFYIPGGCRGFLRMSPPLNPYNNIFRPYCRPLLAMAWSEGYGNGSRALIRKWLKNRKHATKGE